MKDVSFQHKVVDQPVMINTTPFFLQNLLWLCLDFAMERANADKSVDLLVEKMEGGACIRFLNLQGIEEISGERFPSHTEDAILNALGARISLDESNGEFILLLPNGVEQ